MLVQHHLITPEEESNRQSEQPDQKRAAQKLGFEPALQPENPRIDFAHFAQLGDAIAQLPDARRDPVDQDRDYGDGENILAQIGIEGKIEQIKRERTAEDGIVPASSSLRERAAACIANYDPGIERRAGDDERDGQQPERG